MSLFGTKLCSIFGMRERSRRHLSIDTKLDVFLPCRFPLAVLGLANRRITIFNLSNPTAVYKDVESPLKYQTRCVTAFPDQSGYLVGSIEGRVAVHHVEEHLQACQFQWTMALSHGLSSSAHFLFFCFF